MVVIDYIFIFFTVTISLMGMLRGFVSQLFSLISWSIFVYILFYHLSISLILYLHKYHSITIILE